MDTLFQSPVQKKDTSTINDSGYNEPDNQVGMISYSNPQVDTSSRSSTNSPKQVDPSTYQRGDTHITNGIQKILITQISVSFEPIVIAQDLVTSVQELS